MKLLILGSKGMLGNMALKFFSKFYKVSVFDKKYSIKNRSEYLDELESLEFDVLINGIGKIKQKTNNLKKLIQCNSILPMDLSNMKKQFLLIHPSTDCVFSGNQNHIYSKDDQHCADDDYGITKSLGEKLIKKKSKTVIIRTSIIGTTKDNNGAGILDWFLSQNDDAQINGYLNHMWNGITTLKWCEIVREIIEKKIDVPKNGILQLSSPEKINKYDLLEKFSEVFEKQLIINQYKTDQQVNRLIESDIELSKIHTQLLELKKFISNNDS